MILVGNQRGGAKDFALHLIKEENEHVEVHELRGFASENLGYHPVGGIRISPILFVGSHCGRRFTPCALNDCPQASLAVPALTKAMPKLGQTPVRCHTCKLYILPGHLAQHFDHPGRCKPSSCWISRSRWSSFSSLRSRSSTGQQGSLADPYDVSDKT